MGMIQKAVSNPLVQAAPPGRVAPSRSQEPVAPALPVADDTVEIEEPSGLTPGRRAALLGLGLLSLAGPAWAGGTGAIGAAAAPAVSQVQVLETGLRAPAPAGPLRLGSWTGDTTAAPDTAGTPSADTTGTRPAAGTATERKRVDFQGAPSRDGSRLEFHMINDSFNDPLGIASPRNSVPNGINTDDNGWTAEVRLDHVKTEGDRQQVTSGRLMMVTERGSWDPTPDYGGRRQDIVEIAHQRNFRVPLGERTDLHYGIGGGVQLVGPLGGEALQEGFHKYAPFGGRLGPEEGLQSHYTTGSVSVSPMVTGGVGVFQRLDEAGRFQARATLQGTLPLGPQSLGAVRAELGMRAWPTQRLTLEAGVNLTGVYTTGRALDFMKADGVRPGGYASVDYQVTDHIRPFVRMDFGGLRDEPVYSVGVSINFGGGRGEKARLDPLWR